MRRNFLFKIILTFSILTFIIFFFMSLILINSMRSNYLNTIKKEMEKHAKSISLIIADSFYCEKIDSIAKTIGEESDVRITFISPEGVVLGDSKENPLNMDNHSTRIEVISALNGKIGFSIRYSNTLKSNMFYVAVPVYKGGRIIGVVRISRFINDLYILLRTIQMEIVILTMFILVFYILVYFLILKRMTHPLRIIADALKKIGRGDFNININVSTNDEFKSLAENLNSMAYELNNLFFEVKRERKELETILSSIEECILIIDKKGKVVSWNKNFEEISTNISRNKFYWEIIKDSEFINYVKNGIDNSNFVKKELKIGSRIYDCKMNNILENNSFILSLYDITERKRMERMKKELIDNISHELRTPLTSIKGYLETLNHLKGKSKNYIQIAMKNTERLIQLVNDLTSLAELENPDKKIEKSEVNLFKTLRETSAIFKNKLKKKRIKLKINCDKNLKIYSEPFMIEQVFINLLDNAVKYTNKGFIDITVKDDMDCVTLVVEDTGTGIPEQHIPYIFERFYVVDKSRSRELGGTGLGLSIVKHILILLNGKINVESKVGKGTKFTITLPKN